MQLFQVGLFIYFMSWKFRGAGLKATYELEMLGCELVLNLKKKYIFF